MGTIIDLTTPLRRKSSEEEEYLHVHYDTEIIHLQGYDNFYSVMDRLNQRDASGQSSHRLLLVWPVRGRILETPVEFARLRSWALRNHYEIALIIPGDKVKLNMAKDQGLAVFRTIRESEQANWYPANNTLPIDEETNRVRRLAVLKKDAEMAERPQTPFGVRLLCFLSVVFVLAAVGYAVIPQARVDISPYLTHKSINMNIWTDERLSSPTLAGGIPLLDKKMEISLSAAVPASGTVQAEPGVAIGEIIIRNTCDRISASSAGVRVGITEDLDGGINFVTLSDVVLDPGEEKTIRIEAVNGGEEGNLPEGSIRYAEYPKSLCWDIRQVQRTNGGTSGIYTAPSEEDRRTAEALINSQIQAVSIAALENDPDAADLIPLGEASVTAIKSIQVFPEPGYAADVLNMNEKLEVTMKAIRRSDMDAVVRGQSSRMNIEISEFTGYEILSGPKEENGLMTWVVRADYLVYEPQTNEEALQIMLKGKTLDQADSIMQTLDHIKSYKISILPSVLQRMPLTAQNIRVIIHPAVEIEDQQSLVPEPSAGMFIADRQ